MSTYYSRKNVVIFKCYILPMISLNIMQCIAMQVTQIDKPNEMAGESRGVLDLAGLLPGFGMHSSKSLGYSEPFFDRSALRRPYSAPRAYQVLTPTIPTNNNGRETKVDQIVDTSRSNGSKITNNNLTTATPSLDELEKALLEPGIECGRVPLFEKQLKRSINESFDENPDSESEGDVRILHGLDSLVDEWPWIVRIKKCDKDEQNCKMCTGTLLNSRWVITAGHCQLPNVAPNEYKATLGLYDLLTPDEKSFDVAIDKLFRHPDYDDLTNDLLLIRLAKPVEFNDQIQPVCFLHRTRNVHVFTKHRKCYTVGYGLTNGMMDAIKLQKLEITTRDPSECNSDELGSVRLKRGTVCVGPPDGKKGGSCKGDSGGPDLCYDPKANHWVIFGTVSYGPSICDHEIGEKWLTVSTDLSNFRTWVLSTIYHNK